MRALLAETAFVEDEDAISMLNGAEAVRDDERGAAAEEAVEGVADLRFGLGVDAGGGFIQDEKARIVRESAGEINELALTDGERGAAFVDAGADAFRERFDEIGEADFADGSFDGVAVDAGGAEADVGFDGAGEEKGILEDDAELAAQVLEIDFADVDAVEQDLAALNVVEAEKERDERGLAGAGVADDGESLAGLDAERDVAEDPIVFAGIGNGAIAEPDVAKFDFAARIFEVNGVGRRRNVGGLIEELEDALGGGHGGLQDVEFFAEVLDGAEEASGIHGEGGQLAEGERGGEHAIAASPID